ncbi:hypothetical protein DIE15_04830 [Burkholderia sp. Bp9031]|nr:hypothetical protein DIE15_04830 [Burkholderia sp. Bp9031]
MNCVSARGTFDADAPSCPSVACAAVNACRAAASVPRACGASSVSSGANSAAVFASAAFARMPARSSGDRSVLRRCRQFVREARRA